MIWFALIVLSIVLVTVQYKNWGGYVIDALCVLGIVALVALELHVRGQL